MIIEVHRSAEMNGLGYNLKKLDQCKAEIIATKWIPKDASGEEIAAILQANTLNARVKKPYAHLNINPAIEDWENGLTVEKLAEISKEAVESLFPNPIDQKEALERQFVGMSETPYSYSDYEQTRHELQQFVLQGLNDKDRAFLLSIEQGNPDWSLCAGGDWSKYPSIQWKQQNIHKLQKQNPAKHELIVIQLKDKLF